MTIALTFFAGMLAGSIIVLCMGALAAAAGRDDQFERESQRKYVELLERELMGRVADESDDPDQDDHL